MGQSSAISSKSVVGFMLAGTVGFAVDLAALSLLLGLGSLPVVAKVGSMVPAIAATYLLNRHFTFSHRPRRPLPFEMLRYLAASSFALGVNFSLFIVAVTFTDVSPILAAAAATAGSIFLSFVSYSRLVFAVGRDRCS